MEVQQWKCKFAFDLETSNFEGPSQPPGLKWTVLMKVSYI